MKKLLLPFFLFSISMTSFSTTVTVGFSGFTFSPAAITINLGDSVNFVLSSAHDAREVSQSTWNANGNTALSGGFQTPFSGGLVLPAQLTLGMHYYVCSLHASMQMKGTINVVNPSGINDNSALYTLSLFPNPSTDILNVKKDANAGSFEFFVTDQTGRQIINGKLDAEVTPIDISILNAGVYFLQVADFRKYTFTVVKK